MAGMMAKMRTTPNVPMNAGIMKSVVSAAAEV